MLPALAADTRWFLMDSARPTTLRASSGSHQLAGSCLGDWLAYGQAVYANRHRTAVERTSLNYQALRNYAWVARQFRCPVGGTTRAWPPRRGRRPARGPSSPPGPQQLESIAQHLGRKFWAYLEHHQPGVSSLNLPPAVAAAWKQPMRTWPGDTGQRLARRDTLLSVRAFYLDLACWAAEEPARWGQWAVPGPVSRADIQSPRKTGGASPGGQPHPRTPPRAPCPGPLGRCLPRPHGRNAQGRASRPARRDIRPRRAVPHPDRARQGRHQDLGARQRQRPKSTPNGSWPSRPASPTCSPPPSPGSPARTARSRSPPAPEHAQHGAGPHRADRHRRVAAELHPA